MTAAESQSPGRSTERCAGAHLTWPADIALHPDHSLEEALARMREKGRDFAAVVDGDAIVGVLSLRQLTEDGGGQDGASVRDCMVSTVPFVYVDDPLSLAAAIADQTEIEHFCVVDRDHLLLGVLVLSESERARLLNPADPPVTVEAHAIRKRLTVTPGRAAGADPGTLGSYAEGPTLYVHGREVHEPLDQPEPSLRNRREKAMRSKL